jgi:DNA helicase-2/ATP-dependent DNA helicase PcrA
LVKSSFSLSDLNSVQQQAVMCTEGPVLVLAGAGSGKTRVLTYRIAYLIQEMGISPGEILAMTFTKKAAREMQERIEKLVGGVAWIGTFHSIFARILRWEAESVQYSDQFVIYDQDDQLRLIRMIMEWLEISTVHYNPKSIQSAISAAKNNLIAPDRFFIRNGDPLDEIVFRIYPEYQKRLKENQAFDFDDLITVPITLFRQHPEILEKYHARFRYILVDEYQDTNTAQYQLIRLISEKSRNLCVVGDDDQSIYGWRGANIQNILNFEKDFSNTKVFRLEQNYRSTRNILAAAHSVVSKNIGRKPKELWSDNPDGDKVIVWTVQDDREEAYKIVDIIQDEVFQYKRPFRDFAILYRTNAQSRALEDGLRRSGISYVIVGGVRFYDRKEIKDVLAYLKLIVNPKDTVSLKRIINFPTRGIGEVSVRRLETWALENELILFDTLRHVDQIKGISERIKTMIREFHGLIHKYSKLTRKLSPGELVPTLIEDSGILTFYREDTTPEGQARLENIRELLNAIQEYTEETDDPSIVGFLEEVSLINDVDEWNDKSNAVTLMTLHAAKGLEFPVVFVSGLEEQLFPLSRSIEKKEDLEEERRLFYVGLTRAKVKLFLLWAQVRRLYNHYEARLPSRFLDELESSVIDWMSTRSSSIPGSAKKQGFTDYDADMMPDYESFSQESIDDPLQPGAWVQHDMYGKGQIVKVQGRGDNRIIVVRFQNGTQKKFVSKYANLRPVQ